MKHEPMSQERLDAIRGRLDARTPGEWEASGREIDALAPSWGEVVSTEVNCMNYCYGGTGRGVERAEDADLIAHAPDDLADLLAEVQRLKRFESIVSWRYGDTTDGRTREDMVERAARVLRDKTRINDMTGDDSLWQELPEVVRIAWRNDAYSILDAALGTGEGA